MKLISLALTMERVNKRSHSFTCHTHLYPRLEWATLPLLSAAQVFIFRPTQGRRLSWLSGLLKSIGNLCCDVCSKRCHSIQSSITARLAMRPFVNILWPLIISVVGSHFN